MPIRSDSKEHKGTQYDLQDEMDRIAFQVMDDYLKSSDNDIGDKPIEQAESKE